MQIRRRHGYRRKGKKINVRFRVEPVEPVGRFKNTWDVLYYKERHELLSRNQTEDSNGKRSF